MTKSNVGDTLRVQLESLDASLVAVSGQSVFRTKAKKSIEPGSDRFWGYPPE